MLCRLLILVIQFKKADYNTKIDEIEKKILDHDKYVTTQEFNKHTTEHFATKLKQAKLATKNFVKKTDFDDKLKNFSKNVKTNKTRHLQIEKKLNDLSEKVILISIKELTKKLMNKYKILLMVQNIFLQMDYKFFKYLYQLIDIFNFLVAPLKFIHRHLKECQKKALKIHPHQTIVSLQSRLMNIHYQK